MTSISDFSKTRFQSPRNCIGQRAFGRNMSPCCFVSIKFIFFLSQATHSLRCCLFVLSWVFFVMNIFAYLLHQTRFFRKTSDVFKYHEGVNYKVFELQHHQQQVTLSASSSKCPSLFFHTAMMMSWSPESVTSWTINGIWNFHRSGFFSRRLRILGGSFH